MSDEYGTYAPRPRERALAACMWEGRAFGLRLSRLGYPAEAVASHPIVREGLAARDELVRENLGLVRAAAAKFREREDHEDVLQAGTVGLIEAADLYDPDAHDGAPLAALAGHRIRRAILEYLEKSAPVHVPRYHRRRRDMPAAGDVERRNRAHAAEAGRAPLYFATADDREGRIEAPPDPRDGLAEVELREHLGSRLAALSPAERHVVVRRFGLDRRGGASLAEICHELGRSKAHVQAVKARALAKLRAIFDADEESLPMRNSCR